MTFSSAAAAAAAAAMSDLSENDASPSSDPALSPPSGTNDAASSTTYQTPSETTAKADAAAAAAATDKDTIMVVEAGRSLKTMLGDLMQLLEGQAGTRVSLTGEFTLQIRGRDEYSLSLFNDGDGDNSSLKVRIEKASSISRSNGSDHASKRQRDADEPVPDDAVKRPRTGSVQRSEPPAVGNVPANNATLEKLDQLSKQVEWVEQCRRIADDAHHAREETWRASSATFHDEQRQRREAHESWVVSELTWQHAQLGQIFNEIRGLYPLGHSMKWETPASATVAVPAPTEPMTPATLPSQRGKFKPPSAKKRQSQGLG